jgi:hypothetical protein
LFVLQTGSDNIAFTGEVPPIEKIKTKKVVLAIRARQDKSYDIKDDNVAKEIVMMEVSKSILENLYLVC